MRTSFRAWRNRRTHCAQNAAGASPMGVRIPPRGPVLRRSPVGLRFGSSCRCWNGHTGGVESAVRKRPGSNPGRHTKIARVVKLAATAVLNTAAFGRGSSSLLSRTGLWRCERNWHRSDPLSRTGNTRAELALSEAKGVRESCRLRQIVERGGRVGKVTSPENWRALARATGGSIPSPSAKFPKEAWGK